MERQKPHGCGIYWCEDRCELPNLQHYKKHYTTTIFKQYCVHEKENRERLDVKSRVKYQLPETAERGA